MNGHRSPIESKPRRKKLRRIFKSNSEVKRILILGICGFFVFILVLYLCIRQSLKTRDRLKSPAESRYRGPDLYNNERRIPGPTDNTFHTTRDTEVFRDKELDQITYKFVEFFNLSLSRQRTYEFRHPANTDLLEMNQNLLVDYDLCCSVFYQASGSANHKLLSRICNPHVSLQCLIKNNHVMVRLDLDSLNSDVLSGTSVVKMIAECVLKWSSLSD